MVASVIPFLVIFIVLAIVVARHIKIVPQSKRLVVFRLGRFHAIHNPGMAMLVPFIEQGHLIDVERQTADIKLDKVFIVDSDPVNMSVNIGYQVTHPEKAVLNVADYKSAIMKLCETQLRKITSGTSLTELLSERPKLQEHIRESINSAAQEWGININELVISFIDVPEEVQAELRRKAEAERLRRLMNENSLSNESNLRLPS